MNYIVLFENRATHILSGARGLGFTLTLQPCYIKGKIRVLLAVEHQNEILKNYIIFIFYSYTFC